MEEQIQMILEKKLKHLRNELRLLREEYENSSAKYYDIHSDMEREVERRSLALRRREAILDAVSFAATKFLREPRWRGHLPDFLGRLGEAVEAGGVWFLVFGDGGEPSLESAWRRGGESAAAEAPTAKWLPDGFEAKMAVHQVVQTSYDELAAAGGAPPQAWSGTSLVIVPVPFENAFHGVIAFSFDDGAGELQAVELDGLCAAAEIVTGAVARESMERDLAEQRDLLAHSEKLAALGEMAAGIAHELNQPLQIIRTSSDLLGDQLRSGKIEQEFCAEMLDSINLHVSRAAGIIKNVRVFSRRGGDDNAILCDIAASVPETVRGFAKELAAENIQLACEVPSGLASARLDPGKIEQIIINLLSNARDAVKARAANQKDFQGKISVRLVRGRRPPPRRRRSGHATITQAQKWREANLDNCAIEVEDNGVGMDEGTMGKCLQPFFTTKGVSQGTGLGLSIVFGMVKESGGELEVGSTPGVGSVFRILLPTVPTNTSAS